MFSVAKMWIQFLCTRVAPVLNVSNVNTLRAVLLSVVFQKKQVCIGTWIYNNMKRCISGQKVGIFFPHLETTMCKRVDVQMMNTEHSIRPSRSIIGDTLYKQYIELRQK